MFANQYLNRLGLDQDADERAIKRAYARELKQIDQETNAAGFQVLRHAYEMAMYWVKHQPAHAAPVQQEIAAVMPLARPQPDPAQDTVSAAPLVRVPAAPHRTAPARDADTGDHPMQLAQAVFDAFRAICADMVAQGNERDSLLWRKHLQHFSSDDRLLNLAARSEFELLIACLLADGWQPGHEGLFVAARQVFAWEKDSRRLSDFGQIGEWLNRAIDECAMFSQQGSGDCSGQADAITRVRSDAKPSKSEIITHVPHLRVMLARFPAWTSIIGSRARIEQWFELEQAIPAWRRRMRISTPESSTETAGKFSWWKVVLFITVLRLLFSMVESPTKTSVTPSWNPARFEQLQSPQDMSAEAMYQRAAGSLYIPPGSRQLDPAVPNVQTAFAPSGRSLNDAEMKAIAKRIRPMIPPEVEGKFKVELSVDLDEQGAIRTLTIDKPSGLSSLDKAAEKAIRAAAPFGPAIKRRFSLVYNWSKTPNRKKAAKQETAQ